jgi:hypothetical protein
MARAFHRSTFVASISGVRGRILVLKLDHLDGVPGGGDRGGGRGVYVETESPPVQTLVRAPTGRW